MTTTLPGVVQPENKFWYRNMWQPRQGPAGKHVNKNIFRTSRTHLELVFLSILWSAAWLAGLWADEGGRASASDLKLWARQPQPSTEPFFGESVWRNFLPKSSSKDWGIHDQELYPKLAQVSPSIHTDLLYQAISFNEPRFQVYPYPPVISSI